MRNTRKILVGMLAAAGLATAGAMVYADPPAGFGPGSDGCAFGAGGPGMAGGGSGPGMMGYGGGPRGEHGPGMMGYGGQRGGYGPGMRGNGGPRGGYGPGATGAGPNERAEARLAFLEKELKITADQKSAWEGYVTQVKTQAETMAAFHAQGPSAAGSAVERIEQHASRMKLRAEQLQATSTAVKELFAVLTPEQKATADRYFGGTRLGQANQRGYGRGRWN
jgi:hypothetical protein